MQLFQIRKMDGSKITGIIIRIVAVNEHVNNGETTIYIHYCHDIVQKVQSTDKIFKIAWEYHNGKYDRVDKEIKFEEIIWSLENAVEVTPEIEKALNLLGSILPSQTYALQNIKQEILDNKYLEE